MINPACWWHEWNADSRFLFLSSLAASCRAEERFGNSNKKKERKERKYEAKPNNNNNEKCVFIWIKYRCGSSINMGWLLSYLNRVFSTLKHTQFLMHSFVLCVRVCVFGLVFFFLSLYFSLVCRYFYSLILFNSSSLFHYGLLLLLWLFFSSFIDRSVGSIRFEFIWFYILSFESQ